MCAMSRVRGTQKSWIARPFRILAIDPGGTSGWASCTYNSNTLYLDDFQFDCGQIGPGEHHKDFYYFLNEWHFGDTAYIGNEIVCESFEFRQHINRDQAKTKVELMSKEYIGILKYYVAEYFIPLHFQTASAAKTFVPDKGSQANVKLKQLGLYKPITHWVHAMDAMRHLLRHMVITMRIREPITDKWLQD